MITLGFESNCSLTIKKQRESAVQINSAERCSHINFLFEK